MDTIYRIVKNHPRVFRPLLRICLPVLLSTNVMQLPRLGKRVANFASLIGVRAYATAKLCNGLPIKVPRNDVVGEEIFRNGCYEPETVRILQRLLKPGMCFFDVGAHVGQYTLLAAPIVGDAGQVHAFEPDPETFSKLLENVRMNGLGNVRCTQAALAGNEGQAILWLSGPDYIGTNSLRQNDYSSGKNIRIPCMTLPIYARGRNINRVDVLKIDAEGAEYDILASSVALLKDAPPLLILEFNAEALARFGHSIRGLSDLLSSLSYDLFSIEKDGIQKYESTSDSKECSNVFAAPRGQRVVTGDKIGMLASVAANIDAA